MTYETSDETIKFELYFEPDYWDLPPMVSIFIDGHCHITSAVTHTKKSFSFSHLLEFNKKHKLQIYRFNKLPNQCVQFDDGSYKDQLLTLQTVKIDGIDIKNIIDAYSYNVPEYPEPWATLERKKGIVLEERVVAETTFGHDGLWTLEFTSPFYMFLAAWMNGDLS